MGYIPALVLVPTPLKYDDYLTPNAPYPGPPRRPEPKTSSQDNQ